MTKNLKKLPLLTVMALALKMVLRKVGCFVGSHVWTCAHEENIPMSDIPEAMALQEKGDYVNAFYRYARMYCRDCGLVYYPLAFKGYNGRKDDA